MDIEDSAVSARRLDPSAQMQLQAQDPAVMAEVARLLAGRTRDIRLKGELRRLFQERSWPRTAKVIRAWMIWVALLDVLTLGLNAILLPKAIVLSMLAPACILPPAALGTAFVWRKPRATSIQGGSIIAGLFFILLSVALVGVGAGGEFYERHLTIMLFVAITAIIIFSVPLAWTVTVAALALSLYLVFQLLNPSLETGSAVAATLFFASGIVATVVARRTMTILAQKGFLLELRDRSRVAELADANARLERLARTDPLTGIANRRWMMETLNRFWSAGLDSRGCSMLMCDIDEFKKLNDRLGHAEGDRCLVKVAGIIESSVQSDRDHVARYGGEEFLIVLPGVDESEAVLLAERIRKSVEAASLPNPDSRVSPCVTLSIGVATQPPDETIVSPEQLQNQADAALYLAKQAGRNRVVLHEPS
ncbi:MULTISPECIES: GGDEF domain-containing protein [Sinorhizobium]|uniref:diguanylate cyclase n=2 Tax=Sinorhizobium americanum TaxID=194963 RepID=A0A2S3YRL3_9HYPH|nr:MULTISPECIES: GGDEF domain-containing protein [Sinorhizobium]PDT43227.1 GGDEF domain-containing protein [Sinorhizobium sp. FG01]POH34233.1 diguanylate cyclase [Sinorhizobium americanum]